MVEHSLRILASEEKATTTTTKVKFINSCSKTQNMLIILPQAQFLPPPPQTHTQKEKKERKTTKKENMEHTSSWGVQHGLGQHWSCRTWQWIPQRRWVCLHWHWRVAEPAPGMWSQPPARCWNPPVQVQHASPYSKKLSCSITYNTQHDLIAHSMTLQHTAWPYSTQHDLTAHSMTLQHTTWQHH